MAADSDSDEEMRRLGPGQVPSSGGPRLGLSSRMAHPHPTGALTAPCVSHSGTPLAAWRLLAFVQILQQKLQINLKYLEGPTVCVFGLHLEGCHKHSDTRGRHVNLEHSSLVTG